MSNDDDQTSTGSANPGQKTVAVALAYDRRRDNAPKVVAGGRGPIAERILKIALENGVRVREDADLAELLTTVDIGSEIPVEAFAAVAEILVYLYRANGTLPSPVALTEDDRP